MENLAHLPMHVITSRMQSVGRRADAFAPEQDHLGYAAAMSEYAALQEEVALRNQLLMGIRAVRVWFPVEDIRAIGEKVPAGVTLREMLDRIPPLGYIRVEDTSTGKVYEVKSTRL